jgi:hypothetical protein
MRKISFLAGVAVLLLVGVGTWIGFGTWTSTTALAASTISPLGDDDDCKGSAYFALR